MGFYRTNSACCPPKTCSTKEPEENVVMRWIRQVLCPAIKRRDNELADQIADLRINYGSRIHALEQRLCEDPGTVCSTGPDDGTSGPVESNEVDYGPEE